jgi:hypothetical protein
MLSRTITPTRLTTLLLAVFVASFLPFGPLNVAYAAANYYVDCSASSNGNGTESLPWNTLSSVNTQSFSGGDTILLKRGTTCYGMATPQGSGSSSAPITLGAYGGGARPIISAGSNPAAIKLYNQQGWHIQDIETTGGNPQGIYISGNSGTLSHFRITNVLVHDVGGSATGKGTGLINMDVEWGSGAVLNDIIIDNAVAYNTDQWMGIHISCGSASAPAGNNDPVIIRNSVAHNVAGDGITLFSCSKGLIENTVAYETGKIGTNVYGTPNSTWVWACGDCVLQYNEAYAAHSPGVDGGAFDIDWGTSNNIVQYNYGHDNDSYCVSVFGAENQVTVNAIVRYNVCANNGRESDGATEGDFYLLTWNGGSIDGVQIYNNTSYWNPVIDKAALRGNNVSYSGSRPRFFKNNLIYSTVSNFIDVNSGIQLDNNLYWYTANEAPWFGYNGTWYSSFSAYQSGSGQDANGKYVDPQLNSPTYHGNGMPSTQFTLQSGSPAVDAGTNVGNMGSRDFFGNSTPQGNGYDIGAHESSYTGSGGGGGNLISNPGFEADGSTTQTPSGWSEWSSAGHEDASSVADNYAHSGSYKGLHWKGSSYDVYTYQVKSVSNGLYTLKAWVASSGGQSTARMEAKDYGGSMLSADIPNNSSWNQITISNINVTNGSLTIGFYSVASGGNWIVFDDVELIKQ